MCAEYYETFYGKLPTNIDWKAISTMMPSIVIVAIIGPVFSSGISCLALGDELEQEADNDKEFMKLGAGQVATAVAGGFVAGSDNADSLQNRRNGGWTRVSTWFGFSLYLAFVLIPPLTKVFQIIPNPMLGGLYFFIGIEELYDDVGPEAYALFPIYEYAMVWVMLIYYILAGEDLLNTTLIGLAFSVLLLIKQASNATIISLNGPGSHIRSTAARTMHDDRLLAIVGARTSCHLLPHLARLAENHTTSDRFAHCAT